ncbi:MAG: hypothetical protein FWB93_02535 [Oscillospiraceae bacterium]|nr:hypothetical protein [Oscillospiraceae bacterium]
MSNNTKDSKTPVTSVPEVKEVQPEFNIQWIMAKIDEVMKQMDKGIEVYNNAMYAISNASQSGEESNPADVAESIRHTLYSLEHTNQHLLALLEKMYKDVRPHRSPTKIGDHMGAYKEIPYEVFEMIESLPPSNREKVLKEFLETM